MDNFSLVIFGITSNLAQIKLIPALYDMEKNGLLPLGARVIGIARKPMDQSEIDVLIKTALQTENRHHTHTIDEQVQRKLINRFTHIAGAVQNHLTYKTLISTLKNSETDNCIYYLATFPDLYPTIFDQLNTHGLLKPKQGWARLMIEKPIGNDLASARQLNDLLQRYFKPEQVFRLDHYLGKQTLQNILTFRFGNGVFEPLMNKEHIDHIQITAAEDFGIGARGGYFDSVGALKDVGQNHLLQMLAFATMNAPTEFTNEAITRSRVHILNHLVPNPDSMVLGQYQGYLSEKNVADHSKTNTYFAFKTRLDFPRLKDVPIYVRGGKMLAGSATEISVVFKNPINRLFSHLDCGDEPNVLIYRIHPNEAIVLKILVKKPGHDEELEPTYMQFCYRELAGDLPDAYEKLLYDAIKGDQTFFTDAEEVEAEWAFIDALKADQRPLHQYEPGSWGPKAADELIEQDGRFWLTPSMAFCKIWSVFCFPLSVIWPAIDSHNLFCYK